MKKLIIALFLMMTAVMVSNSFADDNYHQQNAFNRFTDWCATIGKNHDDHDRIVHDRIELRAQRRQADWEQHHPQR